jgi:hypothetical protein
VQQACPLWPEGWFTGRLRHITPLFCYEAGWWWEVLGRGAGDSVLQPRCWVESAAAASGVHAWAAAAAMPVVVGGAARGC